MRYQDEVRKHKPITGAFETGDMNGFVKLACAALCLLLALIFLYLAEFCLLNTSIFDSENRISEFVIRQRDPVGLNLLLMAGVVILARLFLRLDKYIPLKLCTGMFLGILFAMGILWVFLIDAMPRADAAACYNTAVQLASDQFPLETTYYHRHPYQVGYTLYSELFVRLLGDHAIKGIGFTNALLLPLAYAAILAMLWKCKQNKRMQLCTIALLTLLIQPVFYVSFRYGLIPGLSFSLWGAYTAFCWIRQRRWWQLPLCGVLCAAAILLKPNSWIVTMAIFLALLLYCIGARRYRLVPITLVVLLLPILAVNGTQKIFEARTGTSLGKGTPQSAWLAMGLQEGSRAAGWYNQYAGLLLQQFDYNIDAARQQSLQDIRERLAVFAADPAYALTFFHNKMVSQWGETTFESIWVNETMRFYHDPPAIVQSILTGQANMIVERYMDGYTIVLFLAFAGGLILFVFQKDPKWRYWAEYFPFITLAIAVFGGWLFHMIFEAKSQYLIVYLPMMVPFAALALSWSKQKGTLVRRRQQKA